MLADRMTEHVVNDLESVHVHEHYRQGLARPSGMFESGIKAIVKEGPVGQAGQDVVGSVIEYFLLGRLSESDVFFHSHEVRRFAVLIPHW